MARRPRILAPGVLYHVIVRGKHGQKTFLSPNDYQVYFRKARPVPKITDRHMIISNRKPTCVVRLFLLPMPPA
jgi:hypothetical protein